VEALLHHVSANTQSLNALHYRFNQLKNITKYKNIKDIKILCPHR
jgi:hypothetical protein